MFDRVLSAVFPGVPHQKLRLFVEKHDAHDHAASTDEEHDPVLLWDECIRRGEEQRQRAELIIGWTMSFQNVSDGDYVITNMFVLLKYQGALSTDIGKVQM